jgi:hypothetical protein
MFGADCEAYTINTNWCANGNWDTEDFVAVDFCCACAGSGGGEILSSGDDTDTDWEVAGSFDLSELINSQTSQIGTIFNDEFREPIFLMQSLMSKSEDQQKMINDQSALIQTLKDSLEEQKQQYNTNMNTQNYTGILIQLQQGVESLN